MVCGKNAINILIFIGFIPINSVMQKRFYNGWLFIIAIPNKCKKKRYYNEWIYIRLVSINSVCKTSAINGLNLKKGKLQIYNAIIDFNVKI